MSYQDIVVTREGQAVEITINRPEKLNAMREQTAIEIMDAMSEAENDRAVRAVIVQGALKAFCTGIDTSEFTVNPDEQFELFRRRKRSRKTTALFRFLSEYTKPVICAVEGYALGGGLELALLGDLVVAGGNAQFGLPETKLGIMPGGGGTQTLTAAVGKKLAKDLIWTGRRVKAEEAHRIGIVTYLVAAGEALAKARELVAEIGKSAPLSIMMTKQAIDRGTDMALPQGMSLESDLSFVLYLTEDREEGVAAFAEKRAPAFKGR